MDINVDTLPGCGAGWQPARPLATAAIPCHDPGIAHQSGAYNAISMQTISLKLPDDLLAQLDSEAKARRVTQSWLVRDHAA